MAENGATGHGGQGVVAVPGNMLDQVEREAASEVASNNIQGPEVQAVPRAPRSGASGDVDGAVQINKWRGAIQTGLTWAEWTRYHYHPARHARRQQYAEARPVRGWTAFAEFNFLDSCVDHSVRGVQEARMRLIDEGIFEADEVNYNTAADLYKGFLSEVGSAAVVESRRQLVTERVGGFQQSPFELARTVRAAHVARYGAVNFSEANKLLYSLLVKPWATIPELKRREEDVKWELQELRFSEVDNLARIAGRIQTYEMKALKEETDARLLRRNFELQRQLKRQVTRMTLW